MTYLYQQKELTNMLSNHYSQAHRRMNQPRNRRRSKFRVSLALLALALLAAPHAARAQVQPQVAGFPPPPVASELKVMTWNIRGGRSNPQTGRVEGSCQPNTSDDYLNDIVTEIKSHAGLDVVALQEVYRSQAFKLRQKLTGHLGNSPDLHFVPTMGCLRLDGDRPGIALISRYKFAAGSEDNVALCSHNPFRRDKPFCPTRETRQLALARIEVEGRAVHLYTTHLALEEQGGVQDDMAKVIVQKLENDRNAAGPTFRPVLMGDFNAKRNDPAYNTIRNAGYLDAWLGVDHDAHDCDANSFTFPTWWEIVPPNPKKRGRIDYVFYARPFAVRAARVTCAESIRHTFGLDDNWEINGEKRLDQVPDHLPLTVRLAF